MESLAGPSTGPTPVSSDSSLSRDGPDAAVPLACVLGLRDRWRVRFRHSSNRRATSALSISSGLLAKAPSKICSSRRTHSRMPLTCASASRFSSCKFTMVLRRLSRFWHVEVAAAPFFPVAPRGSGSAASPLPSPVPRKQREPYYPDSRLPQWWRHPHRGSPVDWLALLAPVACVEKDLDDIRASTARMPMRIAVLMR